MDGAGKAQAAESIRRKAPALPAGRDTGTTPADAKGKKPRKRRTGDTKTVTSSESDSDGDVAAAKRVHSYYLNTGGTEDRWKANVERSMRKEIWTKWRERVDDIVLGRL